MESNQLNNSQNDFYKALIGLKNQEYYLTKFAKFDRNGSIGISWNWSAFFLPFFWLYYRKMKGNAWLYLIATWMIGKIIGSLGSIEIGLAYIFVSSWLLPAMFANAIYHSHCNGKIKEILKSTQDPEEIKQKLSQVGGVSKGAFIFAIVALVVILAILVAIAIPAYQDYLVRAGN